MSINPETVVRLAASAGRNQQADAHFQANVEMFNLRLQHEAQLAALARVTEQRNALAHMTLAIAQNPMGDGVVDYAKAAAEAMACMDAADKALEAHHVARVAEAEAKKAAVVPA